MRIVLVLDGLLKLRKDGAHTVDGIGGEPLFVRIFHAEGHAIDLRPAVVVSIRTLPWSVVHIEGDENAAFVAHIDTVFVLLHLLRKLIDTTIVAVDEELDIAGVIGEGQPQPLSRLEDKGIHHVGNITVIGQQHPALGFRKAQHFMLLKKFEAQGLLVIP